MKKSIFSLIFLINAVHAMEKEQTKAIELAIKKTVVETVISGKQFTMHGTDPVSIPKKQKEEENHFVELSPLFYGGVYGTSPENGLRASYH